jgi:hypothetical protein
LSEVKVIVKCSNGHRFPVNLEKHTDRDYVFCPKCREQVKVRKEHFFSPNPKWMKEKEEREDARKEMKLKKRKPVPVPMFEVGSPVLGEMARAIFEASKVVKEKKKEEVKKEDEQREGTTD